MQLPLALCAGQMPAGMTFDEAGGLPAPARGGIEQPVAAAVSRLFAARRQDGARFDQIPVCPPAGETIWSSPFNRPGVRPGWGRIPPLFMDPAAAAAAAAGPPPPVSSPIVQTQLETILRLTSNASAADRDFVRRYGYPTGTITPAGYWLEQASRIGVQQSLPPAERLFLRALVMSAVHDATICCWQLKYLHWYPRPSQLDPAIRPIISVPNFPSYSSGHASMSGAASRIIAALVPAAAAAVTADAEAAARSRVRGGIHFEFDTTAGVIQGRKVADAVLQSCGGAGPGQALCDLVRTGTVDDAVTGGSACRPPVA